MKDQEFELEVTKVVNFIATIIEEKDIQGHIDVDINGEILNITTDKGVFVINRQLFLKEIWLSSPVSGPYHFAYDGTKWCSKVGDELFSVLSKDLQIEIKQP